MQGSVVDHSERAVEAEALLACKSRTSSAYEVDDDCGPWASRRILESLVDWSETIPAPRDLCAWSLSHHG